MGFGLALAPIHALNLKRIRRVVENAAVGE